MKTYSALLTGIWTSVCLFASPLGMSVAHAESAATEVLFIDAIVASVDEKPITLSQISRRLSPPRKLSLKEASSDPEFRRALEMAIMEELIQQEARARRIAVLDDEINDYLNEISKRNGLSRDEFAAALQREGKTLDQYKQDIQLDILRSKLASSLTRGAIAVSDEEIDRHAAAPSGRVSGPAPSGKLVTLRQILIIPRDGAEAAAQERIESLQERIESGEDFEDLAREASESPEGAEGGLLGTMALNELNPVIYDSIYKLEPGEVSEIAQSPAGYHLFLVEETEESEVDSERSSDDSEEEDAGAPDEEQRERIRESLKQAKLESKLSDYFTTELYKLHSVDKKI